MIKEPKDHWTWYDYKMECVRVLSNHGFRLYDEPVMKLAVVKRKKDNEVVFTYLKRKGWKNFYDQHLQTIVEKHK